MKSPIVLLICVCFALTTAHAQQVSDSVAVNFKGLTVAFYSNPQSADAKLLPLIDGRTGTSGKDRFGLCFGGTSASAKALEFLDDNGQVLKIISVGELLAGKGNGLALLPEPSNDSQQRWTQKAYSVDLPKGKVRLLLKALATGDASSEQQMVVTFALKSDVATSLALRASLPITGNVDPGNKGLLLSPKSGSGAIALSVYPGSSSVGVSKSLATLTSAPVSLEAGRESAVLWMVVDGFGGAAATAKEQAARALREKRFNEGDPRIVVVSSTDKPSTQPGDFVTYSIVCRNIGTGDATDVTLSNPVSPGVQYQEGSVVTDGAIVSFEPTGGAVRNIRWRFDEPIKPGDERLVSFKVQVK